MKLPFLRCRIIWRKKRRFLERENQRNLPRRDVLQESNALMYVKSLEKHKSEARTAASALVTWFGLCIPSWSQSLQCQVIFPDWMDRVENPYSTRHQGHDLFLTTITPYVLVVKEKEEKSGLDENQSLIQQSVGVLAEFWEH
ncbi:uncharacterized protein LOC144577419 isoform X1 [Callithrix jacchus]